MRNQMISSANATKPETANVTSTSRRTSNDVGTIGGDVGALGVGAVAAAVAEDASADRESSSAPTAMSRLMMAAMRNAHEMPSCGISQMPATSAPDTAPAVLKA